MESKKIKILAIDDNKDNLISLKALIKEAFPDVKILIALSGEKGLELAAAEDPDVILLDIVMPGMDGFDVCGKLKADKKLRDIPLVFVTALKGDKESRIRALECGAEAFLSKPIDESELTAQIRAMVKIKTAANEKRDEKERLAALVEEQTRELKVAHTATLNLLEDLRKENEARKKSEETLRESEQRLNFHINNSPLATIEWNTGFVVTRWSGEAEKIFGWNQSETIGKQIMDLQMIYDEDIPIVQKTKERLNDGSSKYVVSTNRNYTKDGKVIICEWYNSVLLNPQGKMISVMSQVMDITGRKQAEDELKEREARLQKIFEILPIGLWFADKNGKLIRGNPAGVKIWGAEPRVPMEEYGVFKARRLPSGQEIAPEEWALVRTITNGVTITDEMLEIDAFDGTRKIILNYTAPVLDEKGQLQGAIVVNNDITERILAEKTLRESEERFRNITEQVTDVVFMTNKRGHITYISPSARSVFGYSQEEMILMPFVKFLRKSETSRAMAEFNLSMRSGQKRENLTFLMKHKDGSTFTGELTANAFYENDMLTGIIGVIRNITERLQADEEIRKSKKLLEDLYMHLNEVRENEHTLISREIHDQIGQSLTALKLDLNWMHKYINTNPEGVAKLKGMIELVSNTIEDVQRISTDLRPGILDDLGLSAAIEWYSGEFEKRTGIKCRLMLDDSIFSDPRKDLVLFRVLQEALTNVIRHANASSVSIILHQSKQGTTMTIQDNGIGIHPGKVDSTKSLGLIGMRERVRQFGGKVDISSRKGQGTKLTVFIPEKKKIVQ